METQRNLMAEVDQKLAKTSLNVIHASSIFVGPKVKWLDAIWPEFKIRFIGKVDEAFSEVYYYIKDRIVSEDEFFDYLG